LAIVSRYDRRRVLAAANQFADRRVAVFVWHDIEMPGGSNSAVATIYERP
jgi:hypothetical protein